MELNSSNLLKSVGFVNKQEILKMFSSLTSFDLYNSIKGEPDKSLGLFESFDEIVEADETRDEFETEKLIYKNGVYYILLVDLSILHT